MIWLTIRDSANVAKGRVAVEHVVAFTVVQVTGSSFYVRAESVTGTAYRVTDESSPTFADAVAKIDDLILNGS